MIDAAIQQKLHYVKVGSPHLDLRNFPDFLIVGPQRTGTTWLHAQLRFHPEIFLSQPKELFFFNYLRNPEHSRFKSNDLGWYLRFFDDPWWRRALKNAIALWRYRRRYRPRIRGEATASYAALDPNIIGEITALNPNLKVILMVRNPIDRAWSHAKKDLSRNRRRKLSEVTDEEFAAFFTDPYQRQCAHYVENCDNWAAHLQPEHLLVCLFDDVHLQPEALLSEVMAFLGVDRDPRYLPSDLRRSVNPTESARIPDRQRALLEELFRPDFEALERRFGISWPLGPHALALRLPPAHVPAEARRRGAHD